MPVPAMTRYVQQSPPSGAYFSPPSSAAPQYYPSPYTPSGSPMTPPPFNHSRSLYACSPLPPLNGHIHNLLSSRSGPALGFDVSSDPAHTLSSLLSPPVLAEPATTPCLPCVTIVSDLFPWRISIYPSSSKPGAYVTVADVLCGIYRELRQQVPADDHDLVSAPQHILDAASRSFYARCKRDASQRPRGLRRIDFLQGRRAFSGLSPTSESPDIWRLDVL
ncbi:hypothetical protein FB45DRAFT_903109 [Roridomyces roridus]|uniref:DUF6699 domain-containing protein n=1 Tax=Roridomyces roridus TaxID=1738132 RepID=A0AAD7C3Y5_9AGAR|nr:hypothetical protein FB45DRAFT_903109 [Roridomyces roridus]